MTKFVIWDEQSQAVSDTKAEALAQTLINKEVLRICNTLVLDFVRLLIVTDKITDDVIFVYESERYPINEYGAMVEYAESLFDITQNVSILILKAALDKKKK